jgi:aminopeptidase C
MTVPFAADVSRFMFENVSRLDTNAFYEDLTEVSMKQPKKLLYENMLSGPNHAMLLTGTNGLHGEWQVENSWGVNNTDYPYITMSDDYFEHYVAEVIVHKKMLPKSVLKSYTTALNKITYYPMWDVFGTLACSKSTR